MSRRPRPSHILGDQSLDTASPGEWGWSTLLLLQGKHGAQSQGSYVLPKRQDLLEAFWSQGLLSHRWLTSQLALPSRAYTHRDRSLEANVAWDDKAKTEEKPHFICIFFCRYREIFHHRTKRTVPGGLQTGGRSACLLLPPEHGGVLCEPQPPRAGTERYQGYCNSPGGEHASGGTQAWQRWGVDRWWTQASERPLGTLNSILYAHPALPRLCLTASGFPQ